MLHKQIGELSGGRDPQTVATSGNRIACMTPSLPQSAPPSTAVDGLMVPSQGAVCQSCSTQTKILDGECYFDQIGERDSERCVE